MRHPTPLLVALRRTDRPGRLLLARVCWWIQGPLSRIPYPLSGARPYCATPRDWPVFVGWRDRLCRWLAGKACSLLESGRKHEGACDCAPAAGDLLDWIAEWKREQSEMQTEATL